MDSISVASLSVPWPASGRRPREGVAFTNEFVLRVPHMLSASGRAGWGVDEKYVGERVWDEDRRWRAGDTAGCVRGSE